MILSWGREIYPSPNCTSLHLAHSSFLRFGDQKSGPLIQNAVDAIRARRLVDDNASSGKIKVRFGKDIEGDWVEVEDNGIGMSIDVLGGSLLDFGPSFWGSRQMIEEFPGLIGKGFSPTGTFGIGKNAYYPPSYDQLMF